MSVELTARILPDGFSRGPNQGENIIGEITEALHRFILDGWDSDRPPPRIEEDMSFVPKDREEVIYVYMYRVAQNSALINSKRWRPAKFSVKNIDGSDGIFYDRAPLYLNVHYVVAIHSKFRSDAERLLGWLMLRLYDASHLVYRPRRYTLPDGRVIDSTGAPWSVNADGDAVIMEKVSLALVDDLTVGDCINFFTIHEAPYRPFLTYQAKCAMEGSLVSAPSSTKIRTDRLQAPTPVEGPERANGRLGRLQTPPPKKPVPGPKGHDARPISDEETKE
jgi:hypothetical protein